jgi:hypothetical protein
VLIAIGGANPKVFSDMAAERNRARSSSSRVSTSIRTYPDVFDCIDKVEFPGLAGFAEDKENFTLLMKSSPPTRRTGQQKRRIC